MKHITKRALLIFVFGYSISTAVGLAVLPLGIIWLANFTIDYVSFFTDWSPIWIIFLFANLLNWLLISGFVAVEEIRGSEQGEKK